MRYSHALDWNPKNGELRALIREGGDKGVIGEDGNLASLDDDAEKENNENPTLYQTLKPNKGEKLVGANLRLKVMDSSQRTTPPPAALMRLLCVLALSFSVSPIYTAITSMHIRTLFFKKTHRHMFYKYSPTKRVFTLCAT